MKKFLTLVAALVMTISMMAIGRNDGSTKANAIDFDWEAPMAHSGGTKWYVVNLDPLYEEETPALNLFLANKDAFNETHTSLKATVAGQTEEKSFTIGPKQQRVWSANATMLVRLKQKEIYLTLTSDGPVMMSARVFEAEDLDETCKDALPLSWTTGITKPAGVPVWYKVNIKDAKANTAQDVCVVVTNNGTKKLTLVAGQSLDCPSSGVTKRTIELEAGQTLRDTVPNTMLAGVAFDELYVSLENDQPISVRVEYADRPLIPVMPADLAGKYTEKIVPDTSLHTTDVTTLTAGVTYYFKYDVSKLNALKKYEPEFTFRNLGTTQANIVRKMAFEVPAFSAQGNTLVLNGNDESIEVIAKNTLIGLEASYIYVMIISDQDIQLISRFKHLREGKACKTNIDFDWVNGHTQSASTKLWYAIDVADARDNIEDIIVHVQNLGSKTASLDASVAFSCPYIDLQEMHHNIAAGTTEVRTLGYSTYAMMTDTIWIGVETNQDIKFWATTKPAKTKEPDEACLAAVDFNWEEGVRQNGGDTVWYKIAMDEVREQSAKFPTVFVQNLSSTNPAKITAELSLECPDSIENQKRTKTLAANASYSKQLSRNLFENIVQDTIYLRVITTEDISLQIRLTEEAEGASCSSAIPFNWVSGNSQTANQNLWYIVDMRTVMKQGNDIRLHIENRENTACNGVAQLIYECPTASSPSVQDFKLGALATKSITVQNSAFETLSDSMAFVNLQGTTGLRFWVELLPLKDFDTIYAEGLTLIPLQWDSIYTQTVDTAWYIVPQSEIEKVKNLDKKVKPVAHLWNLGTAATTIKAEGAFAFPITKQMMTKSQKLKAGQHYSDTIPAGTFDQLLKKDSIIIRVTRPAGSGDFQFQAELVSAFSGNTRYDALPITLGEQYIQQPNTEMWYRLNTADLKKDPNLFNKRLSLRSQNIGTNDAEVTISVYEGLLSNVDILEDYGLGDYRKRTIKKGENRERTVPAQAVYGLGDVDLYILVRSTGGLRFGSKFAGEYGPQAVDPKQQEAKLLVPNVEYVVPNDGEEHWYMVCIPYMQNNYEYTDNATLDYELNGAAKIEVTATLQDVMDCAMPVRTRTINKSGGYHKGTKPVRELIEKAIKKAGYTFDFSGTDPQFMDSLLHRYITKDSITAYVRIKTDNELKVKLNVKQTTGDDCTNPMEFDWEHGNVNPDGANTWYRVQLDSLIIPDTCDLRLHVDNWSAMSNNVQADLYFDCNDPKTKGQNYTIDADGKDSLDIDRDFLAQLGWADMIINYNSDYASHIWAELIPNAVRDTLRDTIVAYVCQGGSYLDTITNITHEPIIYSTEWRDTVTFKDGVTMKDSVTLFQIHPLVLPEAITVDSMKKLAATPLLAQGMQLFVDSSSVKLTEVYKNLGNTVDTIIKIDTVYWAEPVYSAPGVLDDTQEAALDLTSFYPKTQTQDTLLLVIKGGECGFILRTDYVFPLEDYKYASKNDTICPPAPAKNPDTLSYATTVLDTLNLPRYVDTIVSYAVRTKPVLYAQAQLTPVQTPIVACGASIDITGTIESIKQQFEDDADDLTMAVTDAKWQVLNGTDWQDLPYTVPATATSLSMRYIIDTECGIQDTSANINFTLTPACTPTYGNITVPDAFCDSYRWTDALGLDTTVTLVGTNTYVHTFAGANAEGCDSIVSLTVTINQSYDTLVIVPDQCESYNWVDAAHGLDTLITNSNTYSHTFTAVTGCDSVVSLKVVIKHGVVTPAIDTTECDSFYWAEADTTITSSGTYSHTFTAINGCDSLASYNVTINPSYDITVTEPVVNCVSYYWAEADTTINTEGTHAYKHKFASIHGCDSVVTLTVTINMPTTGKDSAEQCYSYTWTAGDGKTYYNDTVVSYTYVGGAATGCDSTVTMTIKVNNPYQKTLSLVSKYGDRLLMINRNEINALPGWNLDLENDTALVQWYKEDPAGDIFLGFGYYYTKNGEVLDAGVYYAKIDIPASEGATCGSKGETVHYTVTGAAPAPALAPSLARPGEDIKVLNLDPDKETVIRVYTTEGLLHGTYTVSGETSFTIKAAYELGFYLVELNNDGMKTTLRYIVK